MYQSLKGEHRMNSDLLQQARYRLDELERQIKGATMANARAAMLEREVKSLRALMDKGYDPKFIIDKLKPLEDTLAGLGIRVSVIEAGIGALIDEVEDLNDKVGKNAANTRGLTDAVSETRKELSNTTNRVTTLEEVTRGGVPVFGIVIAIILGTLAGWLWARHNWSSTFAVGDQTGLAHSAADSALCAWLFGFGIGFVVLVFETLIARSNTKARALEASTVEQAKETFSKRNSLRKEEKTLAPVEPKTEVMPAQPVKAKS